MALVYIAEYADFRDAKPYGAPVVVQDVVTVSTVSIQAAAFGDDTNWIRVHSDGIVSYVIGTAPTATTTNMRMAADQTDDHIVKPGDTIAFIVNS